MISSSIYKIIINNYPEGLETAWTVTLAQWLSACLCASSTGFDPCIRKPED